jgi:hypothetical protein
MRRFLFALFAVGMVGGSWLPMDRAIRQLVVENTPKTLANTGTTIALPSADVGAEASVITAEVFLADELVEPAFVDPSVEEVTTH